MTDDKNKKIRAGQAPRRASRRMHAFFETFFRLSPFSAFEQRAAIRAGLSSHARISYCPVAAGATHITLLVENVSYRQFGLGRRGRSNGLDFGGGRCRDIVIWRQIAPTGQGSGTKPAYCFRSKESSCSDFTVTLGHLPPFVVWI